MQRISLLLLILVFAGNVRAVDSQPPPSNPVVKSNNSQQNAESNNKKSHNSLTINKAVNAEDTNQKTTNYTNEEESSAFNGWSVGDKIAAIIAVIALFQFIALFRTYFIMRDTARRQLRSYVGLTEIELEIPSAYEVKYTPKPFVAGQILTDFVVLTVTNYGATTANNVITRAHWQEVPFSHRLPTGFHYVDKEPLRSKEGIEIIETSRSLFPGQTFMSKIAINDVTQFIKANQNEVSLFLYGNIKYVDIFGESHWSDFCYVYEHWRPRGDRFTATDEHNDAT